MMKTDVRQLKHELQSAIAPLKSVFETSIKNRFPELYAHVLKATAFSEHSCSHRSFQTRLWYVLNEMTDYPICPVCKNSIVKNVYRLNDPRMQYCNHACAMASDKTKQTRKERSLAKWCVDNPSKSADVKARAKQRCIEKYGVASTNQLDVVRKKKSQSLKKTFNDPSKKTIIFSRIAATCLAKNGYDHISRTPEHRRKLSESAKDRNAITARARSKAMNFYLHTLCTSKFVIPCFSCNDWISTSSEDKSEQTFMWHCLECGRNFTSKVMYYKLPKTGETVYARCFRCHPNLTHTSAEEKEFAQYVNDVCNGKFDVIYGKEDNYKFIAPYQLDVVVIDKKSKKIHIAFEYNGSAWHSKQMGSDVDRQLNKTLLCESHGIRLVHVFENEWLEHQASTKELVRRLIVDPTDLTGGLTTGGDLIVDRSKFCKSSIPDCYECIAESPAQYVKRRSSYGIAYDVGDCGQLTLRRMT